MYIVYEQNKNFFFFIFTLNKHLRNLSMKNNSQNKNIHFQRQLYKIFRTFELLNQNQFPFDLQRRYYKNDFSIGQSI